MKKKSSILSLVFASILFARLCVSCFVASVYVANNEASSADLLLSNIVNDTYSEVLVSSAKKQDGSVIDNSFKEFQNSFNDLHYNTVARTWENTRIANSDYNVIIDNAVVFETSASLESDEYNLMRLRSIEPEHTWSDLAQVPNGVFVGAKTLKNMASIDHKSYKIGDTFNVFSGPKAVSLVIVGIFEDELKIENNNKWKTFGYYLDNVAYSAALFVSPETMDKLPAASITSTFTKASKHNGSKYLSLRNYCENNSLELKVNAKATATESKEIDKRFNYVHEYYSSNNKVALSVLIIIGMVINFAVVFLLLFKSINSFEFAKPSRDLLYAILAVAVPFVFAVASIFIFKNAIATLAPCVSLKLCNNVSLSLLCITTLLIIFEIFLLKIRTFKRLSGDGTNCIIGVDDEQEINKLLANKDPNAPKKVVICTLNPFATNSASSLRDMQIAKMFKKNNYDVTFITFDNVDYKSKKISEYGEQISLKRFSNPTFIKKLLNHFDLSSDVASYLTENYKDIDAIVLTTCINEYATKMIYNHFKKYGTKFYLIADEKFTLDEFGKPTMMSKVNVKLNNYFIDQFTNPDFKIICISSYLEEIFKKRNMETIRIPFVFDDDFFTEKEKTSHVTTNFLYAGIPFNKDALSVCLEGFGLLSEEEIGNIKINLIGVDDNWVQSNVSSTAYSKIKPSLICYGVSEHDVVIDVLSKTDFTFLLRDPEKVFAKAGFPTKVTESLFNKTPVITNITSDLNDYLVDGKNALIVPSFSDKDFAVTVKKAMKLNKTELMNMFNESYKTAREKLSLKAYEESFNEFIK